MPVEHGLSSTERAQGASSGPTGDLGGGQAASAPDPH
jgi:hypothetical protein